MKRITKMTLVVLALAGLAGLVVFIEVPDVAGTLLPGFQCFHLSRQREGGSLGLKPVGQSRRSAPL